MATTVRSAVLYDALDLRVEQLPAVPLLPGHVAIRPKYCGLCGSDLHFYFEPDMVATLKATHPLTGSSLPQCFGHEFAGVVTELGEGCEEDFAVGDKVVAMPTMTDEECWACANGHTNTCSKLGFVGIHGGGGGLSDRVVLPARLAFKLPGSIDYDIGALVEPIAVAWHSLKKPSPPIESTTTVLVIGAGPVGCAVVLCLLAREVETIVVSEPTPSKRDFALQLGASDAIDPAEINGTLARVMSTTGKGFDVVFDCAGIPGKTLDTAVRSVRPQGTIVNLSLQLNPTIPLLEMIMKEVQLKCSLAYTKEDYVEVIQAIDTCRLNPAPLISKRIKLEDVVQEGLIAMHDPDGTECKILVNLEM